MSEILGECCWAWGLRSEGYEPDGVEANQQAGNR
jgi:hypothetical protein